MGELGADRALELAAGALSTVPGAEGVEVVLTHSDSALTRFAESRIHQNVARSDGTARVRVVADHSRVGVVTTNDLTPEGLARAVQAALDVAWATPPDPQFAGLAPPSAYLPTGGYDDGTASSAADERAEIVADLLSTLPPDTTAAGAVETAASELVVANSRGVLGYHRSTRAAVSLLGSGPDSTGYAEQAGPALAGIDVGRVGRRVADKVQRGRHPREVAPGEYAVILEPAATVTLLEWLAWTAFGGKAVAEGRSPLSGRLGEQVCSEAVTITDDAYSTLLPGVPFDVEGVRKQRVELIRGGVAKDVVHDLASARAAGVRSTGHALPAPNSEGPVPQHLVMEPGEASVDDLVAGCERGLLVTRFHYTNLVHPIESTITGMTRDGTFLVEDGQLAGGVRNLRFTQSILGALSGVEAVGSDLETASDFFFGAAAAPAVRLSRFSFSSTTSF